MLRVVVGVGLAGLLVALIGTAGAGAAPTCAATLSPADETAMTALINRQRVSQRVKKVASNTGLRKAGRAQSLVMARGGSFTHSAPMPWAGGRAAAQNIAYAPSTPEAFQAMMASPEHRYNILNAGWRLTGVGVARNCQGMLFFTVNLLAPPPQ